MRSKGGHSFPDRMARASLMCLSDEHLLLAICADSPSSASKTCLVSGIHGGIRIRIGAVAQILRDYPEQILVNPNNLPEMVRIRKLIFSLPERIRGEVLGRLLKLPARSLKDNAGK